MGHLHCLPGGNSHLSLEDDGLNFTFSCFKVHIHETGSVETTSTQRPGFCATLFRDLSLETKLAFLGNHSRIPGSRRKKERGQKNPALSCS